MNRRILYLWLLLPTIAVLIGACKSDMCKASIPVVTKHGVMILKKDNLNSSRNARIVVWGTPEKWTGKGDRFLTTPFGRLIINGFSAPDHSVLNSLSGKVGQWVSGELTEEGGYVVKADTLLPQTDIVPGQYLPKRYAMLNAKLLSNDEVAELMMELAGRLQNPPKKPPLPKSNK